MSDMPDTEGLTPDVTSRSGRRSDAGPDAGLGSDVHTADKVRDMEETWAR
jgi:hypothetical protein